MAELFGTFMRHLVWALMLWVVLFVVFAGVFARGQLTAFAAGIGRVLLSIVISPFVFLRKAAASVLGFTRAAEDGYRASDQYLLNKGMLVLQAVVIVAAIGALAAGVVATWVVLVPPSEVRRAAREYRVETEAQREKAVTAATALAGLETEWAQKRDAAIDRYRKARTRSVATSTREAASLEQSLASSAQDYARRTFASIRQRASGGHDSRARIWEVKERLDRMVPDVSSWYWSGISTWERNLMLQWNAAWATKTIAQFELDHLPEDEVRAAEQASYPQTKELHDQEAATLAGMETVLAEREEAASLKWKAAAAVALRSFVAVLIFLWVAGVFIEAGWLAIRVADDVRRIRTAATVSQANAGVAPEVHLLPVREVVPSRGLPAPSPGG